MTTLYVDIHVLQSVPPANVNRDQSGRPKTATYGGVERARVSSQAWKRATRAVFQDAMPEIERSLRTRQLPEVLGERISGLDSELTPGQVDDRVSGALAGLGLKVVTPKAKKGAPEADLASAPSGRTEYLIFLSHRQIDRIAQTVVDNPKAKAAEIKKAAHLDHGIEVALFGRMIADAPDLRVDAACQVAH